MQFWKKYKAKKELRKKLEKARFINFYEGKIDLSLGKITTTAILNCYKETRFGLWRDYLDINDFIKSSKFTERLNEYEQLKKEYEGL